MAVFSSLERVRVLVTCEHGGAFVPPPYRPLFRRALPALCSHRGYDPGALPFARRTARRLKTPLLFSATTRLLVDLNRSAAGRNPFSEWTRILPAAEKERLLAEHHRPFRDSVSRRVAEWTARGFTVLHLSIHSFTPRLRGKIRPMDVGLLYDPSRRREAAFCAAWQRALIERHPGWKVRRNAPYRGVSDGMTTSLRREFPGGAYLGIELEINQRHIRRRGGGFEARLEKALLDSIERTIEIADTAAVAGSRRRSPEI
jgi:predicted N-formylglutamate amidohydrolase